MDENQEQPKINDDPNSLIPQAGENMNPESENKQKRTMNSNIKDSSAPENEEIDYSNLDIEESTGGSAMEQENENVRDIDKEEI